MGKMLQKKHLKLELWHLVSWQ